MAKKLHVDIETFSSVDIKEAGAYKYAESPDFEILMISYAVDDGPVINLDLTDPYTIGRKESGHFKALMKDPTVEKWAHNAAFERTCFNRAGLHTEIKEWYCTAIKSLYCGLPQSLDGVSKALNLGDKAKLATGKKLIKYFCVPCRPTKANGNRTRNLPEHAPEDWRDFRTYCNIDVEAEREIARILSPYKIPDFERENYILDQEINDRGIEIDAQFAKACIEIDSTNKAILFEEIKDLTELDNPNSPAQLKNWLGNILQKEIKSLDKKAIPQIIESTESEVVRRVLHLRQKTSKTSIKKYEKMVACQGADLRGRGFFQFYGANRTGRWAGRLVQLQNLPQNHLKHLDSDRELMRTGDYGLVSLVYEEISSTLSQLVRTAFVAKEGHTFAVADFSSIEARVLAWLAGETWRLDVFNTHGKIYEASAAMMFNVPLESIDKGSDLRQKGKVAELALGYQGSLGALKQMGGEAMGLSEVEMQGIVARWRDKSPNICRMWRSLENAALRALKNPNSVIVLESVKGIKFLYDNTALRIKLPSGRSLFYWDARIGLNPKFGNECIKYRGVDQTTKTWTWLDTYGGKITENVVQAVARDILADSMRALDREGFEIVMHVHDEAAAEVPIFEAPELLENMCEIMGRELPWTKGLPLKAEGYVTQYYKKD